uniref:Recep_L_domain domain-containing protein n=1 Tax=Caenorhabditis tropicalis TaxID=1561998 RepID=A0A1I7T7N8_9PELO
MNYILSLLIIGFIHLVHSKIDKDLQTFFKKNKCDQKCTFESGNLTFGTIDLFPSSCETVCADLQLDQRSNLTENELTSVFKNMKHLIGRLKVLNTNYTSGKFLSGLESIECDGNGMLEWGENFKLLEIGLINLTSIICYRVDIWQNFNLTRLNMPNLKILFYPWSKYSLPVKESYIALTFLSTDFCITTNEMATTINVTDYISYKYCEPVLDDKLCKEPVKGCIEIFGDLEITDDTDLEIMKTIEIIYGSLIINGTDIKDFGFLESLKYVASLEKNMEAIIVENNPKLNNITFPRLKESFSLPLLILPQTILNVFNATVSLVFDVEYILPLRH